MFDCLEEFFQVGFSHVIFGEVLHKLNVFNEVVLKSSVSKEVVNNDLQ